jgi:hypothetical protein
MGLEGVFFDAVGDGSQLAFAAPRTDNEVINVGG